VTTYGGKKTELEDGFAVFTWDKDEHTWTFHEFVPDAESAKHTCDRAIAEDGCDAAYYVPAVFRAHP
jgi:hypothetical protein